MKRALTAGSASNRVKLRLLTESESNPQDPKTPKLPKGTKGTVGASTAKEKHT